MFKKPLGTGVVLAAICYAIFGEWYWFIIGLVAGIGLNILVSKFNNKL